MAATITLEMVDEVWQEFLADTPEQMGGRVERFRRMQPVLAGYVRAVEEGAFSDDDRGEMTFYTVWAHEVFLRAGAARREIDEETIEAMLVENEKLLAAVENAPASDVMSTAMEWTETYRHMPMLGAVMAQAMAGDLEETRRVDDFLGLLTLHMKTVIDCLALE